LGYENPFYDDGNNQGSSSESSHSNNVLEEKQLPPIAREGTPRWVAGGALGRVWRDCRGRERKRNKLWRREKHLGNGEREGEEREGEGK